MRRLLCISNSIADTFKWRTSMRLTNHHIRHWSPYDNPHKMRGLDEINNAIVWVDRPTLSSDHEMVLKTYRALGMREFEGTQHLMIRSWLLADDDPTRVPIDRDAALSPALGDLFQVAFDGRDTAKQAGLPTTARVFEVALAALRFAQGLKTPQAVEALVAELGELVPR